MRCPAQKRFATAQISISKHRIAPGTRGTGAADDSAWLAFSAPVMAFAGYLSAGDNFNVMFRLNP